MNATSPPKLPRGAALRVTAEIAVGTILDEKYRIESILGRGGMATVFAARHETLGHRVAIKVLSPDGGTSPARSERVLREARAAAGLTSENVTRVLDVGALDSGEPYIVMEVLDGVDLARLLSERGPLPVRDVASYLVQACDAVAEAHARNIVHRDLKPSNLFLTHRRDGSPIVKLMDFGISKDVSEDHDASLTRTQDSLGTPHFMSPEQLMTSRDVDARTDVWALGVILYRLLTAEYPFSGETTPAVHVAVASAPAPLLRAKRPDAPEALEDLVSSCLIKSRADRLQTVSAFVTALLPFADEETQARYAHLSRPEMVRVDVARATSEIASPHVSADAETRSAWDDERRPPRAQKSLFFAGIVVVAVISVGGAAVLTRKRDLPPTTNVEANGSTPVLRAIASTAPPTATESSSIATPSSPSSSVSVASHAAPRHTTKPAVSAHGPSSVKSDPYGQRL